MPADAAVRLDKGSLFDPSGQSKALLTVSIAGKPAEASFK